MSNVEYQSSQHKKKDRIQTVTKEKEPSLKGTFVSVMLLGGFIILSWLGVWMLYLAR